jgi:hypothetical protein
MCDRNGFRRFRLLPVLAVIALAIGVSASTPGPVAQAQQPCTETRGIIQALLPSPYLGVGPDGLDDWGGTVYAAFGGETLIGIMSGGGGGAWQRGARGERYTVYLCNVDTPGALEFPPACPDSITYEVPTSVFGFSPGKTGLGYYTGNTARIISGTGRFLGASGNLNTAGPYILWPDSSSRFGVDARWNAEFSGRICGIR